MVSAQGFYKAIKHRRYYDPDTVGDWFQKVSQTRVEEIGDAMEEYISTNLPKVIRSKSRLADYRTSPYVLMATAGALQLDDLRELSKFLVDIKLYMGLETSFGKSIEKIVMSHYPMAASAEMRWGSPAEKDEEFATYAGLSQEEKSRKRINSVWREIDSACVHGDRRHLMTIKSGIATINDTQVGGMHPSERARLVVRDPRQPREVARVQSRAVWRGRDRRGNRSDLRDGLGHEQQGEPDPCQVA